MGTSVKCENGFYYFLGVFVEFKFLNKYAPVYWIKSLGKIKKDQALISTTCIFFSLMFGVKK